MIKLLLPLIIIVGFIHIYPLNIWVSNYWKNVKLEYKEIINTNFNLATHSSFIATNYTIKNIFETLINPPKNKEESCCYERLFGLYFIIKKLKTINISERIKKIHGNRS